MKSQLRALCLIVTLGFSVGAWAQATRTWVSGVGDDVNPCSRTAPCKTFAGAISKTAAGGVISVLDPGGFGVVTIAKSLTIDGGGIDGSITTSAGNGITINAAATDHVVLRRLAIYGAPSSTGSGIRVLNSTGRVTVEQVAITGFNHGIEQASTGQIYVHDTVARKSANHGMLVSSGKATVVNSRFEANTLDGIRVTSSAVASVSGSTAAGNNGTGFAAVGGTLLITNSTAANNVFGIGGSSSGLVSIGDSLISNTSNTALSNDGTASLFTTGGNSLVLNATTGTFTGSIAKQ